jgi:hypothetical protein
MPQLSDFSIRVGSSPVVAAYLRGVNLYDSPSGGGGGGVVTAPFFVMDTTEGVYTVNGVSYASEAEMSTALGISKSGESRVFPPYISPTADELVTNGSFNGGDVSGWAAGQLSGSGAAISAGTGDRADMLRLTTGGATQAFARQTKTGMTQGKAYALAADVGRDTTGGQPSLGGSHQASFQSPGASGFLSFAPTVGGATMRGTVVTGCTATSTSPTPNNIEPQAWPASVSFRMGSNASSEAAGVYVFDNASIKEAVILPGAVWNSLGGIITFTTPASFTKTETVIQFGVDGQDTLANSERSRMRLSVSAAGVLTYEVVVQNLSAASQELGTLAPSTQYSVWFHNGPDSFGARLGADGTLYRFGAASNFGLSILGKSALNFIPALGRMDIGRSRMTTAANFTGVINKLVLRSDKSFHRSRPIISLGNSLAGVGAGGIDSTSINAYYGSAGYHPQILARALSRLSKAVCFSFGGGTATDIRNAFGDGSASHPQRIPGQWAAVEESFGPYADLDPIFVYNTAYNAINPANSSAGAISGATGEYNGTTVMHENIKAVFPQFDKFVLNGCRWGTGVSDDVEWRLDGFKTSATQTLNSNLQLWAASRNDVIWNDIQADLIDPDKGLSWAGLTANAQDLTDISRGQIPSQLRIDGIHQSAAGQRADAESARLKIAAAGWDSFGTVGTIYAESL